MPKPYPAETPRRRGTRGRCEDDRVADQTNEPAPGTGSPLTSPPDVTLDAPPNAPLDAVLTELDEHATSLGWDRPPALFALVGTAELATAEPALAASLGLTGAEAPDALTPIEQEPLDDGPLDEVLARIAWPDAVVGCVLIREALVLPPSAGAAPEDTDPVTWASGHPDRREVRLTVGVLRDGRTAGTLRLRPTDDVPAEDDPSAELVRDEHLAPELAEALLATLR